ncbi:MAG TPA: NAD(P)-dependent oxidoreductase [Dehalococcoidia bacterium]|nr:NAD(P)-dependent oxidoreductase [Dehalococcoidia bacterium]
MKVLVTGGAGYVGCILVEELLAAGHAVRVFDNLRKGPAGLLHLLADPRLELVRGDVRDGAAVRCAMADADAAIHLAAVVGYPACERDPWQAREVNVDGTVNVIGGRSDSQPIIFPSSLSNYGAVPGGVCTEEMEPRPITLYGSNKLEAERRLLDAGNAVVLRPATAFGLSPQMRLDLLFNDFVYRALKERQLTVYQSQFMRAFIHVRDFARALVFALDNFGTMRDQVYNLGDESLNLTKGELAERVADHTGCRLALSEAGEDPDKRDYLVDFSKLRATGFRCRIDIDEGIEELARGLPAIDVPSPYSNTSHY